MARTPDDFVFFWKPEQPNGWASQWYKSPFTVRVSLPDGEERDVTFPTAEHWMMGQKALLFGDQEIFQRIVGLPSKKPPPVAPAPADPPAASASASANGGPVRPARLRPTREALARAALRSANGPRVPGPKEVKALGRKVRNFSETTWEAERVRIVLEGSLHKFRQNAELRALLLATGERELVEASPMDRVWGVGVGAKRAAEMCVSEEERARWGANLLGKALEEARRILREESAHAAGSEGEEEDGGS